MISRRGILSGLIAAPSIVVINNIMPVKAFELITNPSALELIDLIKAEMNKACANYMFEPVGRTLATNIDTLRKKDPRLLNFLVTDNQLSGFSVYYTEAMKQHTTRLDAFITKQDVEFNTLIYDHI